MVSIRRGIPRELEGGGKDRCGLEMKWDGLRLGVVAAAPLL